MPTTSKPRNKRLELGDRSREEILDAAQNMLSQHGYEGASVSRIAAASALSSSSIYWHFGSKVGILTAVMERGAERFFAEAAPPVLTPRDAPRDILRRGLRASQAAAEAHPEFLRILFLLTLSQVDDERVMQQVQDVTLRGRARLHELLERAFQGYGPEVAGGVADRLVDYALSVFDGIFFSTQASRGLDYSALIERMADSLAQIGTALAEG